jgi:SAM-dependent methyltransferase
MTTTTAPVAAEVYALGSNPAESVRLQRQSDELRPQSAELLGRIGLAPGQSAIDLGCGPSGILDLLSAAVFPGGRVVGLDADPAHTSMARQHASKRGLLNVDVVTADARHTGLPPDRFDVVHAPVYPAEHSRRTILPGLVRSLRPMILQSGLSDERELAELDRAVRQHLADPRTLTLAHLLVVTWGRKPRA